MTMSAAAYLEHCVPGRHPDLPATTTGTLRLDVGENGFTNHWRLTIDHQTVRVDRSAREADLVIEADREVFDDLAAGRRHIAAAYLGNDVTARGRMSLLLALRRIFPGPPDARHPREVAVAGGAEG